MAALYGNVIRIADKFVPSKLQPLWNHAAGNLKITLVLDFDNLFMLIINPIHIIILTLKQHFYF